MSGQVLRLSTDGRWSGGGCSVMHNLEHLSQERPDILSTTYGDVDLVARNVLDAGSLIRRRAVLMPQNAWPWGEVPVEADERVRRMALRTMSEISIRRSIAIVRISPAIPNRSAVAEIVPNVLDAAFDRVPGAAAPPWDLGGPYLIAPGSLNGYRNTRRLIKAFGAYRAEGGRLALLIVGQANSGDVSSRTLAAADAMDGLYVHPYHLDRSELGAAIAAADGVVLPSLVEASPILALEAIALNGKVAVSDIPGHRSLHETRLYEHAYFDPRDTSHITRSLHRLETDETTHCSTLDHAGTRTAERRRWSEAMARALEEALHAI